MILAWALTLAFSAPQTLRLHLINEPASFSPFVQKGSGSLYLLNQLMAPLMRIENDRLLPDRGTCRFVGKKQVACTVDKNSRWSDGVAVVAEDYARTLRAFADPKVAAFRSDFVLGIRNAEAVLKGEKPLDALGVKAEGNKLTIDLQDEDPDFLYWMAHPLWTATKADADYDPKKSPQLKSAGPYVVQEYSDELITLSPNSFYDKKARPRLQFRIIRDDLVASQAFAQGQLDFLRRLPTALYSRYAQSKELKIFPQFRFDYIALSESIPKELRKKIASSLNFDEIQELLKSPPRYGCVGVPDRFLSQKLCLDFSPPKQPEKNLPTYDFWYSKQGGDDHRRVAEWIQLSLKKNLGLQINVQPIEDKLFISRLRTDPPPMFRKGLVPERPTCLAVLENFLPGAKENYLRLNWPKLNQAVDHLKKSKDLSSKKKHCTAALKILLDEAILIPTGPIHFMTLVNETFAKNVELDELNHLQILP